MLRKLFRSCLYGISTSEVEHKLHFITEVRGSIVILYHKLTVSDSKSKTVDNTANPLTSSISLNRLEAKR